MRPFRNCSIRRKLTAITLLTSACALTLVCGSALLYQLLTYRNSAMEDMRRLAEAIGMQSKSALIAGSPDLVSKSYAALPAKPAITRAGVYEAGGKLFHRCDTHGAGLPQHLDVSRHKNRLLADRLAVFQPINSDGETVGIVFIEADVRERRAVLTQLVVVILIVLPVSTFAAYLLSSRLQRMISGPILHLAHVARIVSEDQNYTIRAKKRCNDELGLLIDGFNDMLEQVQHRDAALLRALDHLRDLESVINRSHVIAFLWSEFDGWSVEFVSDNIHQLGYTPDDFTSGSVPYSAFVHPDDLERLRAEVAECVAQGCKEFVQQYRVLTKSGDVRWMDDRTWVCRREDGSVAHYQGLVLDITEKRVAEEALRQGQEELETRVQQRTAELADTNAALQEEIAERKRAEVELLSVRETLQQQATHDPLTGLPNRLLFSDRLNQQLALAHRSRRTVAVMFLDLDRFKTINDTLGHDTGDMLLRDVSDRLSYCVREADTLARMGGDEFTIILSEIASEQEATVVGQRVIDCLSRPFLLDGREIAVSASLGISLYPAHGSDVETLVRNADRAMYRAKQQGRNQYQIYTERVEDTSASCQRLEIDLREALERDEFVLHYQPRVNMKTGKIMGAEALLRWRHPNLGLLYPDRFISLAEASDLILALDEWALRNACRQNKMWQDNGMTAVDIAVNLSAAELKRLDLPDMIERALRDTGLNPHCLTLEFTGDALLLDEAVSTRVLEELKALGVRISIDDFGSTNSSLASMRELPVDSVKIDRAFVRDVTSDPDTAATAGAIVAAAHSLNKTVVAEGVETLSQLEFLRSLNCDEMQGYFVSKPAPAEVFEQMMKDSLRLASNDINPAA